MLCSGCLRSELACKATDFVFGSSYKVPKVPRSLPRYRLNPMDLYHDEQFLVQYKLTKATMLELLVMLPPMKELDTDMQRLTPMLHLQVALRFYAHWTFQVITGDLTNVSQPTVCCTVNKGTSLITRHLFRELVHFANADEYSNVVLCTSSSRRKPPETKPGHERDLNEMVRVFSDKKLAITKTPGCKVLREVAAGIVGLYPTTFQDTFYGAVIATGLETLHWKLETYTNQKRSGVGHQKQQTDIEPSRKWMCGMAARTSSCGSCRNTKTKKHCRQSAGLNCEIPA